MGDQEDPEDDGYTVAVKITVRTEISAMLFAYTVNLFYKLEYVNQAGIETELPFIW